MTYPIQPGPSFRAAQSGEKPSGKNTKFLLLQSYWLVILFFLLKYKFKKSYTIKIFSCNTLTFTFRIYLRKFSVKEIVYSYLFFTFNQHLLWFVMWLEVVDQYVLNGPRDRSSILSQVIPKTQKKILDAPLLNTQYYKERIKGKVEQSRKRNSTLPYTLV